MNRTLRNWFVFPGATLVLGVVLMLAVVDFVAAVMVLRNQADREYQPPKINGMRGRIDEGSVLQSVSHWLGASAAQSTISDELVLEGIVSESGRFRVIVRHGDPTKPTGQRVSVGVGDQVAGWQVVELSGDSVVFKKGEQERRMALFRKDSGVDQS